MHITIAHDQGATAVTLTPDEAAWLERVLAQMLPPVTSAGMGRLMLATRGVSLMVGDRAYRLSDTQASRLYEQLLPPTQPAAERGGGGEGE